MSRIHPSSEKKSRSHRQPCDNDGLEPVPVSSSPKRTTLTVWKRSSMSFQGTDGFTVYDRHGRLAFRVDNYSRNSHVRSTWSCSSLAANGAASGSGALVLMDGSGKPLITLKPQIFSIQNQWNGCIYKEGENISSMSDRKIFMMRRPSVLTFGRAQNHEAQCEAEVFFSGTTNEHQNHPLDQPETGGGSRKPSRQPDYRIEGSFWNRNCKIMSIASGEVAAKITRKKMSAASASMSSGSSNNNNINSSTIMLSEDVFSLVVNPGFDTQIIMAFVVILDRICFKPFFTHVMCS